MGLEAALITNRRGWWVLLLIFGGMLVTLGFWFAPGFYQWLGAFHIGHFPLSGTLLLQGLDSEDRTHPRDGGPM